MPNINVDVNIEHLESDHKYCSASCQFFTDIGYCGWNADPYNWYCSLFKKCLKLGHYRNDLYGIRCKQCLRKTGDVHTKEINK